MSWDRNILVAIWAIAGIAYFLDQEVEFLPIALLGVGLSIFFAERVLIGSALSFSAMTVPSVFMLGFIAILCLGTVITWDTFDGPTKLLYLQALLVTLVVFPVGVWVANLVCGMLLHRREPDDLWQLDVSVIDRKFEDFFWLFMFTSIAVVVLFFAVSTHVQLIDFLLQSPTALDPDWVRFTQTELPKPVQYLFEVTRRVLLPLCMLYAYFMKVADGGKWRWLFPTVFLLSLIVSLLTLDRSPPMGLMAMLAVAHFVAHRHTNSKWLVIALIIVTAIFMAGIISIFQYQSSATSSVTSVDEIFDTSLYVATYRIFGSPPEMAIRAFETYNYDTYFLNGEHVRLFNFLSGGEYVESASTSADPLAVAPVTFVGDLWRNWGWEGVIVGAFAYGFILQFLQVYIFDRITVLRAAIYVLLILGSLAAIHGNAFGVITLSVVFLAGGLGVFVVRLERRNEAVA